MTLKLTGKYDDFIAAFLLSIFVVFIPLNIPISEYLSWSIYPYFLLLLISVNIVILNYKFESKNNIFTSPANLLMILFSIMLLIRVENFDGFKTIIGAVLLPYIIGALYALRKNESYRFEKVVFILLIIKALSVLLFYDVLLKDYPVRPEFQGRAIYLKFGWALDVLPFLVVYYLHIKKKIAITSIIYNSMLLFIIAFVIVAMMSRTIIILSVLITVIFSLIYINDVKLKIFSCFIYPLFVFFCLTALPVKQNHLLKMFYTISDTATQQIEDKSTTDKSTTDKSTNMRLDGIFSIFLNNTSLSNEYQLNVNSGKFYWAGHFWFSQIKYYLGILGLVLFISLISFFIYNVFQQSRKRWQYDEFSTVVLIMISLSYFLHIFYAGGILNNPVLFLIIGLVVNFNNVKRYDCAMSA